MAVNQNIKPVPIEQEMQTAFLDYSMSVIVSRALPDIRDGLKPVQRRILFVMHQLGLTPNRPYRKCATIVGECLGKYHPHGDQAVYDALVRLAQDWNMRYPMVDGQGNFGSIDGDSPAAYRYTEARLTPIALEMLTDIEKNTVEMRPNFDGRLDEPTVLPSGFPNLLVNGSYGIAVGMATDCPPHNLTEICNAIIYYIDNPSAPVEEFMEIVPGPDFPTGAIICGKEGIRRAYKTGTGQVKLRARIKVVSQEKTKKKSLLVEEIPYQVTKQTVIESIAKAVENNKVSGITDLRDESDREGMRLIIELKSDANPQVVLNQLYQHTQLQNTSRIHFLALVNNIPRVLNLKDMIQHYVQYRSEIVERRTRFDLEQAERRAHILEGLLKAIDQIDEVINLIRKSANAEEAQTKLCKKLDISVEQAKAILAMPLRRLTGLERKELQEEYDNLLKEIKRLKHILSSRENILAEVRKEVEKIREKYGDERKTEILETIEDFDIEDLIADEAMIITVSNQGYIKRMPQTTSRKQRRRGQGVMGMETPEDDFVKHVFTATAHEYLMFFTNEGRVYWRKVHEIPEAGRTARGRNIKNLLALGDKEKVTAFLSIKNLKDESKFLFMVTRKGLVKKTPLFAYSKPRSTGIQAITLEQGDELMDVLVTSGIDNVLLATHRGLAIRFPEKDVRPMGRTAQGVVGIRLDKDDYVVGVSVAKDNLTVLTVTENGYGKRTEVKEYRIQHRGGKGIINIQTQERNGNVVTMLTVSDDEDIVVVATDGKMLRIPVKSIRVIGRNTKGVQLMNLREGAKIASADKAIKKSDAEGELPEGSYTEEENEDETGDLFENTPENEQNSE
ncbi:MAG: DNA gyrase subunit A [Candidatus Hydrogenedens sp.]